MAEQISVDRATLERVAAALAAYMGAMRADIPARETIMERIRLADRKAQPAYAELYALLHPALGVAVPRHDPTSPRATDGGAA